MNSVITHPARKRLGRHLRAVAVVGGLVAAFLVAPSPAHAAEQAGQKFMTVNFHGRSTAPGDSAGGNANVPALVSQIGSFQPRALMLQEVCKSQVDALVTQLGSTWPMQRTFTVLEASDPTGCPNGDHAFGDAILVPAAATVSQATAWSIATAGAPGLNPGVLPSPLPAEKQRVTCLKVTDALAYPTAVCNTHIKPGAAYEAPQIQNAVAHVDSYGNGMPVAFGGDFNVAPTGAALDPVYKTGGAASGRFEEIDQCGGANPRRTDLTTCNYSTHDPDVKLDYIFLKQAYFKGYSSLVQTVAGSDHKLLRGQATICSTATC